MDELRNLFGSKKVTENVFNRPIRKCMLVLDSKYADYDTTQESRVYYPPAIFNGGRPYQIGSLDPPSLFQSIEEFRWNIYPSHKFQAYGGQGNTFALEPLHNVVSCTIFPFTLPVADGFYFTNERVLVSMSNFSNQASKFPDITGTKLLSWHFPFKATEDYRIDACNYRQFRFDTLVDQSVFFPDPQRDITHKRFIYTYTTDARIYNPIRCNTMGKEPTEFHFNTPVKSMEKIGLRFCTNFRSMLFDTPTLVNTPTSVKFTITKATSLAYPNVIRVTFTGNPQIGASDRVIISGVTLTSNTPSPADLAMLAAINNPRGHLLSYVRLRVNYCRIQGLDSTGVTSGFNTQNASMYFEAKRFRIAMQVNYLGPDKEI